MSTIGLLAHLSTETGEQLEMTGDPARDAISLALALMAHNHRLLLHVSANLIAPLLLAGEMVRSQLVLEDAERLPHPIVMLPVPIPEGPERALFAHVEIGPTAGGFEDEDRTESHRASLFERLHALGVVDTRWLRAGREALDLESILAEEAPDTIVAMGWSAEMEEVVVAAESLSRRRQIPLLRFGLPQGPLPRSESWRNLEDFVDFSPPEVEPLASDDLPRSEEFFVARRVATRRARLSLAAEALALRLHG
jgi:hypothetical protein